MTYFTGVEDPETEASRNEFRAKEHRTKLRNDTPLEIGDLYLSKRSPGSDRYYVSVDPGAHGLPDDEDHRLVCVTHEYRLPYEGADLKYAKWERYDAVGHMVIRINKADGDPRYAASRGIESALYETPLGRAVGRDTLRQMSEALAEKFGLDMKGFRRDESPTFVLNTDDRLAAKKALKELLEYYPERGYPEGLGKIGAEVDNIGFAEDADEYEKMLDGDSDGFGGEGRGTPAPVLSQPVFYLLCGGKDSGRTMQAIINELKRAIGVEDED